MRDPIPSVFVVTVALGLLMIVVVAWLLEAL